MTATDNRPPGSGFLTAAAIVVTGIIGFGVALTAAAAVVSSLITMFGVITAMVITLLLGIGMVGYAAWAWPRSCPCECHQQPNPPER